MNKTKQPGIRFENIMLKNFIFSRNPKVEKAEVNFEFSAEVAFSEKKDKLTYALSCLVKEKKEQFTLDCTMIGFFSYDMEEKNMELENFADVNAPALILPYLREVISSTTLKAGMPPLFIPPMNIVAMLKNKKEE